MVHAPPSGDPAQDVLARLADGDPLAEAFTRALAEGRLPTRRVGRGSTYSTAIAQAWCDAVAAGCTVREAAKMPGMPSLGAIYRWLDQYPEFRRMYALAVWKRQSRDAEAAGEVGRL
jgi:hypothetical protein